MRYIFTALAYLFLTNTASAQWVYQKNESAFSDTSTNIAFTTKHQYGFGFRCSSPADLVLIFMTPDKSFEEYSYDTVNASNQNYWPELIKTQSSKK